MYDLTYGKGLTFGSAVNSRHGLRTRGAGSDPHVSQFLSKDRLMTVISTGLIPLSPQIAVFTMAMWRCSQ